MCAVTTQRPPVHRIFPTSCPLTETIPVRTLAAGSGSCSGWADIGDVALAELRGDCRLRRMPASIASTPALAHSAPRRADRATFCSAWRSVLLKSMVPSRCMGKMQLACNWKPALQENQVPKSLPYPRIEGRVQQVSQKIHQDIGQSDHQNAALHQIIVAVRYRRHGQPPDSGPRKNRLGHDRAGQ